jgi:tetratricopeptide (TPR) repeat protein
MQQAGESRRLGDILVAIDAVSRRELERCVRAQVEEVVFELLNWSEGYFSFTDGAAERAAIEATASIPTEAVLMEAARRIDEWARIETKVPHLGVVPRLRPAEEGGAPLDLVPFEWEVLAAVDGRRDLRAIAAQVGRSEFDVARTIYGLMSAGLLALDEVPPISLAGSDAAALEEHLALAETALAVGRCDEAESTLRQVTQWAPGHAAAWRLRGLALAGLGRHAEAVESWDEWSRLAPGDPDEAPRAPEIDHLRRAAGVLAEAMRGHHG